MSLLNPNFLLQTEAPILKKTKKTVLQTERRMKRRTGTPFYRTLLDDYFCRLRRLVVTDVLTLLSITNFTEC